MKPTQQEIIEVAHEAGYPDAILEFAPGAIERLVHLALERFGAGSGEPVAEVANSMRGYNVLSYACDVINALQPGAKLYAHPSPDSLRAEYLRGLEAAAVMVEKWDTDEEYVQILADHIRALKGKQ